MNRVLFYKYEVLRPIGAGSTGTVYLARDLHLDQLVAVKESTEEFLLPETALLKELDHPGLPRVYDCFRQQEYTYLVMEYVEGMTLRQYLDKHGRVSERQAVRWAIDLCRVLGYLHGRHPAVIYRDLKPENIMIRPDGGLKLIDLGGTQRDTWGKKKEELCVGTPGYCPMKQRGSRHAGRKWDLYGLGAVLHEMLTGVNPTRQPYERRPVSEYDRALSGDLDRIIRSCMSENDKERYQSMEQAEDELLHYPAKRRWRFLCQTIQKALLALTGAGTVFGLILPLLRGIPDNQIPFPYLVRPFSFLTITLFLYLVFYKTKRKKQYLRRQEKNIWLTEKKFSGFFLLFFTLFFSALVLDGTSVVFPASFVWAEERQEILWVEMRDESGRKLLLKNDAVYMTSDRVRFELPAGRLPGKELSMQIVAVDEDGERYSSRIFRIQAQEKEDGSLN